MAGLASFIKKKDKLGDVSMTEVGQESGLTKQQSDSATTHRYTGDQDFDSLIDQCVKLLEVKGEDYTIGTGDRLHNFKTVSSFMGMTPESVLGAYFYKHVAAVFAYIKSGGQNESEPIDGRIADCINYLLLFNKMVQERRRGNLK